MYRELRALVLMAYCVHYISTVHSDAMRVLCNGDRTEWSPIRSVSMVIEAKVVIGRFKLQL